MNLTAFWSGLLGTTIPAFGVSVLMLYLTHRTNRAMEQYKKSIARDLSNHQLWHEKQVDSLLAIYDEFRKYLDFLRRALYIEPREGCDVTPQHDFFNAIQTHLVFFNDDLRQRILGYQGELLEFWNWSVRLRSTEGEKDRQQVQKRLDFEIPQYLEKLRKDINQYADPSYEETGKTTGIA